MLSNRARRSPTTVRFLTGALVVYDAATVHHARQLRYGADIEDPCRLKSLAPLFNRIV